MKKNFIILTSLVLIILLSACTPSGGAGTAVSATTSGSDSGRLSADYSDALTVQSQLALGTLQLEETDLAVDEALAAEILPLWQAVQSLSNSETAASAEINAVLNQIQDTMNPAQIQAIADMALTNEKMATMFESGELNIGRGFGQGQGSGDRTTNDSGSFRPGGGFPGGGPGGGAGGGPGGGLPGGGTLSEDDIATRQAELESGDGFAQFQDRALLGAVIRILQTKTGEAPAAGPGDFFSTALAAVGTEIGLSVEEIQTRLNDGQSLVEIIEGAGSDVDAVRTAMIDALSELEGNGDFTPEQLVDNWLQQ